MFYVIYNSATKQYLNEDMEYGSFYDAWQFASREYAHWDLDITNAALKVVGPCIEGEEP